MAEETAHLVYDPQFEEDLARAAVGGIDAWKAEQGREYAWSSVKEVRYVLNDMASTARDFENPEYVWGRPSPTNPWTGVGCAIRDIVTRQWQEHVLPHHPELTSFQAWRIETLKRAAATL